MALAEQANPVAGQPLTPGSAARVIPVEIKTSLTALVMFAVVCRFGYVFVAQS